MCEMSRAVGIVVETGSCISLAVKFGGLFRESKIQRVIKPMCAIAKKSKANILDMKVRLKFVKSRYVLGAYILT